VHLALTHRVCCRLNHWFYKAPSKFNHNTPEFAASKSSLCGQRRRVLDRQMNIVNSVLVSLAASPATRIRQHGALGLQAASEPVMPAAVSPMSLPCIGKSQYRLVGAHAGGGNDCQQTSSFDCLSWRRRSPALASMRHRSFSMATGSVHGSMCIVGRCHTSAKRNTDSSMRT
jgi:hypothetical protein